VRAEGVAFVGVERAFDQGAENGGLDVLPVLFGGGEQGFDLRARERQGIGGFEQLAVEVRDLGLQGDSEFAAVHRAPQVFKVGLQRGGAGLRLGEQLGEGALGQQLHVFGKHGEQAAGKETSDKVRIVAGLLQFARQAAQVGGDRAGDTAETSSGLRARGSVQTWRRRSRMSSRARSAMAMR